VEFINQVENRQKKISRVALGVALFFLVLCFTPALTGPGEQWPFAVAFISLFLFISAVAVSLMYRSRSRKLEKLKRGDTLLAYWKMSAEMIQRFSEAQRDRARKKNKTLISIMSIFFVVFTVGFLIFMEADDRLLFAGIMGGVFLPLPIISVLVPIRNFKKDLKGDGVVMVGEKYAYFNGAFHNWDYPLSGISKVKLIQKPYYGLYLSYYYTDRTFTHTAEFNIPAPSDLDLAPIVDKLKQANRKSTG